MMISCFMVYLERAQARGRSIAAMQKLFTLLQRINPKGALFRTPFFYFKSWSGFM